MLKESKLFQGTCNKVLYIQFYVTKISKIHHFGDDTNLLNFNRLI